MNDKTIRIGIIGAGNNTRVRHIPGLKAIEGVEIVGVCNRGRESSQRVADEFGIEKVHDLWSDVIADAEVDAVVIGTWPNMHCRATVAALEADKHVMCEARLAMNLAEARAMRDAAAARPHLVAQVVPAPFSLPVDRTIQKLIAEGYLGEILAAEVRVVGPFIDPDAPLHWRQDVDLSGRNIMSMGIWYEQVMRWIGEAKRLQAMGKVAVKMRPDTSGRQPGRSRKPEAGSQESAVAMRPVRVPDHVDVTAEMACGAQLHMRVSSLCGLGGSSGAWLFGSEGTLCFADGRLRGARRDEKALGEIPIPPELLGGRRVEEEFISAIRGHEPITHTTFETGVKYMAFTEAVVQSMTEGRTVEVEA